MKSIARRLSPHQIAVFPLGGTMVLPGCELPLNIFEPRYLNMVDDALKGDRLIGMIQPQYAVDGVKVDGPQPALTKIGTLARMRQFSETDDGRYMISLVGLKRFRLTGEAEVTTPYRQALVTYEDYAGDIDLHETQNLPPSMTESTAQRARLTAAMKSFAKSLGVEVDWDGLKSIAMNKLVDQTSMISPFGAQDTQSLLEAPDHDARRKLLVGLMEIYTAQASPPQKKDLQ